jgi:DNA gyrase subunit A
MKTFKLSDIQATHILDMQLRRLTSMEVSTLRGELAELRRRIAGLSDLLGSKQRQSQMIAGELQDVSDKVGVPRRSLLVDRIDDDVAPVAVVDEPATVTLNAAALVGRAAVSPGSRKPTRHDVLVASATTSTAADVAVITASGRLARTQVAALPPIEGRSRGGHVSEFFSGSNDPALTLVPVSADTPGLLLVTRLGVVKRISGAELAATKDQAAVISFKDPTDRLAAAFAVTDADTVAVVTSDAQLLAFPLAGVREQGRAASGVAGMRLGDGAHVIAAGVVTGDAHVVTVTDAGRTKWTPAAQYPTKGRGGSGVRCHKLLKGEESLTLAYVGPAPVAFAGTTRVDLSGLEAKRDGSGSDTDAMIDLIGWCR